MQTLAEYLLNANIRQSDFATRAGISKGFLNDILKGRRDPSLRVAKQIVAATGGSVSIESFGASTSNSHGHRLPPRQPDAPEVAE